MAYDFHLTDDLKPKLIEVNTNASGFLISDILNSKQTDHSHLELIKKSIIEELKYFYNTVPNKPNIAIIDEDISEQKMNFEFYIYKSLFQSWGFDAEIYDYSELKYNKELNKMLAPDGKPIDLVYNRYCDFLLSEDRSQHLKDAYLNKACAFSPQPKEYLLLADKNRLIDFTSPNFFEKFNVEEKLIEQIKDILIPTFDIKDFESPQDLWSKRKKLFFKPKRSHGGKGTYRGKNITKKVFQQAIDNDSLVQELVPAPTFQDEQGQKWKYDLRFYTYKDEIQLVTARSYQGQVTNFSTDFGGFTNVEFI